MVNRNERRRTAHRTGPTQTEIARELGLSRSALSMQKAKGCPVHSADAARAWRAENLHPGRARSDPGPSPRTLVERVHALIPLGREAMRTGRLELVAEELRSALRAVPHSHRDEVIFDFALWAALIGDDVVAAIREDADRLGTDGPSPDAEAGPNEGDLDQGDVLYALACGEARLLLPL